MVFDFDEQSRRSDRQAKHERRTLYVGGLRAMVALGAFAAAIAYVFASDNAEGPQHVTRGLMGAAAAAAPFWLLALWGVRWREPKLAPYTLIIRAGAEERTRVCECLDDYAAAQFGLDELGGEDSSVIVSRGPPESALPLGTWSVVDGQPSWRFLRPEWGFYESPLRRRGRSI